MRVFGPLYDRVLAWSAHPRAPRYLAALSFAESSFFPIPPDVMLVPMAVARPERGAWLALLTTLASVAGALLGYAIGYFALESLLPWIEQAGLIEEYRRAVAWFDQWGLWVVLLAGFTPVPYKAFTIAAGALSLALVPFLAGSLVGRGARFALVAAVAATLGPRVEPMVRRWVEWLGWGVLATALIAWLALQGHG
ncbi:MAG: YqaA family protein [Halofilum sp. (in: g-proteobacteria)]|nr:YqaA family protein [Halofilum sp. (in: g-proteobacteria)]